MKKTLSLFVIIIFLLTNNVYSEDRKNNTQSPIKIVSSFSAYRAAATAAEIFGQTTQFRSPVVESMGSGKAMEMFCSDQNYTFVFVSRSITEQETRKCKTKNNNEIVEVILGNDAIILVNAKEGPNIELTYDDLYKALISEEVHYGKIIKNSKKKWNDINKKLPNFSINFYGPSVGSGMRDVFIHNVIRPKCLTDEELLTIKNNKIDEIEIFCQKIRNDSHYIAHGDDYFSLIKKIQTDDSIISLVNSYVLSKNSNIIKGIKVNGIEPTMENIISNLYTLSIPIIIYYKNNLLKKNSELFLREIASSKALGSNGYLTKIGINSKNSLEKRIIK